MKTHTTVLAGLPASILVGAALVLFAGAAPAHAHTPEVEPTCSELTVTLANYGQVDGSPNTVVVMVDGTEVENASFGATFNATYPFDDSTVGHDYAVVVDADGTDYDRTFAGTTDACPETEEPPVVPPVVVPPVEPPVVVPPAEPPVVVPPAEPPVVVPPVEPPVVVPPVEPPVVVPPVEPPVVVPPVEPPVVVPPVEPPVVVPPVEPPVVVPPVVVPPVEPPVVVPPVEPPVVVPPVEPLVVSTTVPVDDEVLASTGADTGWIVPLAGSLLLAGLALMFVRRTRKA